MKNKKYILIIAIILLFTAMILGLYYVFSSNGEPIIMGLSQSRALNEREAKSINFRFRKTKTIRVVQEGDIKVIERNSVKIDSVKLILNDNIGFSDLIETDNYFLIHNLFPDGDGPNIFKYSKDGTFISSFGRKGKGPGEIINIEAITEKDNYIYISDNGSFWIFSQEDKIINNFDLRSWVHYLNVNNRDIDLSCSYNKVFSFPFINIDRETGEIKFTIKDDTENIINDSHLGKSTLSISNDTMLFYIKKADPTIYAFSKPQQKFITDFSIESQIVRTNNKIIGEEKPSRELLTSFIQNLWQIEAVNIFQNKMILIITDSQENDSNLEIKTYLLCFDINLTSHDNIPLFVYDLSNIRKVNNKFNHDKLYWYVQKSENIGFYYSLNLKEIIK